MQEQCHKSISQFLSYICSLQEIMKKLKKELYLIAILTNIFLPYRLKIFVYLNFRDDFWICHRKLDDLLVHHSDTIINISKMLQIKNNL